MPPKKKQKSDIEEICIIHWSSSNQKNFINLFIAKDRDEKFERIKEIGQQRLGQGETSPYCLHEQVMCIPSLLTEYHGYHRDCYQRFTKNLDRLGTLEVETASSSGVSRRSSNKWNDGIIFNQDCIFCNKIEKIKVKREGSWTYEGLTKFKFGGGSSIQVTAAENNDFELLRRIQDIDLFSKEAMFHPNCRKSYMRDPTAWRSNSKENIDNQRQLESAHKEAFQNVEDIIDKSITREKRIISLQHLKNVYIEALSQTNFPNINYRADNLKAKIERSDKYKNSISFAKPQEFVSYLVYNNNTPVEKLICESYQLGSDNQVKNVSEMINENIKTTFAKAEKSAKWPIYPDDLNNECIPTSLCELLSLIIYKKKDIQNISSKKAIIINSISQDICRAATNGKWKLPKHIGLAMSVRHLFRSKELTTILNRFGHAENYSFIVELETAISYQIDKSSSLLTEQIIRNPTTASLFHSDFDNFDQYVNDVKGAGSIHTAHGIMLQEVEEDVGKISSPRTQVKNIILFFVKVL